MILRALAKTPDTRYATADEMGIDLDRVRKGLAPLAGAALPGDGRTRRLPVGETVVAAAPSVRPRPAPVYEEAPVEEAPRRVWPWLLLLLLVPAAGGALAYALLGDGDEGTTATTTAGTTAATTTAPELVTMPAVGGRRIAVARRQLEALGLEVGVREVFEARPAGTVIGQSIRAGTEVERGSPVTLRVSKGPQPVPVPKVVGAARQAAETTLRGAGFEVRVQEAPSDDVPAGAVISQDPAAAAQAKRGDTITIVVSTGREQAEVPSVIGLTEIEARRAISEAGLEVAVEPQASATIEAGLVIESNPRPGAAVDPGSTVTIVVSSGPEQATVPEVRGQTQEAAIELIEAAGLTPVVEEVPVTDPAADNLVSQQNPAPGARADQGAEVAIVVGRLATAEGG